MKKLLMIAASFFLLMGCGRVNSGSSTAKVQEEDKTVIKDQILSCTKDSNTIQFRATGDEITSTINEFERTLEDLNISDELDSEEIMKQINSSLEKSYGDLEGVEVTAQLEGDAVKYRFTINYLTADHDALIEAGILNEGEIENQYISLEKTQKEYEENGFACTVE